MKYSEFRDLWNSDLYRYGGGTRKKAFIKNLILNPGFQYSYWMRLCKFLKERQPYFFPLYAFSRLMLLRYVYKYGISIPYITQIDKGFYIGHFSGIVINAATTIGKNCNISQGVTIGQSNRGDKKGTATIGDNVYIGPGAKIFGSVRIGNNVAIGANCVVTKDIPDNAVVVGIPGKIISYKGSYGYVDNTDYAKESG
jgi:serine O-acetyltransferase